MARPRKSRQTGEETTKSYQSPKAPYSGKVGGNIYVVYVHYLPEGAQYPRVIVHNFAAKFAVKWFLLRLIGNDEWEFGRWKYREEDAIITTSFGIHIKMHGEQVHEIMDYEFADLDEEGWGDIELAKGIAYLKWGKWEHGTNDNEKTTVIEEDETGAPVERRLTAKELRAQRREEKNKKREADPQKGPRPKVDKTGKITAGELADQMGILPREFRAVLRKLKMEKPAGGWLFDEAQAEDIKKKVKKGLK